MNGVDQSTLMLGIGVFWVVAGLAMPPWMRHRFERARQRKGTTS